MLFDDAALNWDTPERIERAQALAASLLHSIGDKPKTTVLEFGCGTGLISFALRKHFESIYCVDTSEGMLNVLRKKIEKTGSTNLMPADIGLLEQKEFIGMFDVIYSSMVFHHILDVEAQLRALHPLLKPGGLLITIDLDQEDGSFHRAEPDFNGHNGFDRKAIAEWMQACGFSSVRIDTVYQGKKGELPYSLFLCRAVKKNDDL